MKIGVRLGLGFGLLMLLLVTVAGVGILNMGKIEQRLEEVVNDNMHKMKLVNDMSEAVHVVARVTRTIVLVDDDAAVKAEQEKIAVARKHYDDAVATLEKTASSERGKAIRAKIREAAATARPLNQR
ncbi:MAG: MCP four helix bundle domain-containing protein, partial [Burkholderiales bacterium]